MTNHQRLLTIRGQCYEMLRMAQVIRIQQTQATAEAKWPKRLTENADAAWAKLNRLNEAVDKELENLAAELSD